MKGDTTFDTSFEEIEYEKVPDILLCPLPGFKDDLLEKYNIGDPMDVMFDDKLADSEKSIWDMYQYFSYVLDIDFEFFLNSDGNELKLKIGKNISSYIC